MGIYDRLPLSLIRGDKAVLLFPFDFVGTLSTLGPELSSRLSEQAFSAGCHFMLCRRVKDTPNFISSGSKIVKRLRRRQYDPVIIERTIGLVLGPSTALYEAFLKHCTLTNKAVGLYDGPCPNLLRGDRVLIFVPSDC